MRVKALLLTVAAVATLSACANADPDTSGTPGPTGTAGGPATGAPAGNTSGRDSCLLGTWKVDVNDVGQQTAAKIGNGAVGSGTGTLTVAFGDEMKVTYGNTVVMDMPVGGKTMNMKSTFAGEAVSTDWKAKDGKITGTMSANNVTNSVVATVGGVTVPTGTTVPFSSLNLSETVGYTCSGTTASIIGQGVSWKLTKA